MTVMVTGIWNVVGSPDIWNQSFLSHFPAKGMTTLFLTVLFYERSSSKTDVTELNDVVPTGNHVPEYSF